MCSASSPIVYYELGFTYIDRSKAMHWTRLKCYNWFLYLFSYWYVCISWLMLVPYYHIQFQHFKPFPIQWSCTRWWWWILYDYYAYHFLTLNHFTYNVAHIRMLLPFRNIQTILILKSSRCICIACSNNNAFRKKKHNRKMLCDKKFGNIFFYFNFISN